jgi:phage terminase small subunit
MANRLSKEKAGLIASNYMTNGLRKVDALLDAGYSTSYANNVGLKLFDNDRVKEAIAKIQAKNAVDGDMTIEKVQEMYLEMFDLSKQNNQPSSGVSAITGIARLYGMDKDASTDKQEPDKITTEELERLRELAVSMSKPKLHENTA